MTGKKFERFITYAGQTPPPDKIPTGITPGTEMFYIHNGIIPGAFVLCGTWLTGLPENKPDMMKQHYHEADEYIGMFGCNHNNPLELGAELEFWFEDEKYTINKSCVIFIPKKIVHAPIVYRKISSPFFLFSTIPDPLHQTFEVGIPKNLTL
jgi:hypothetical protein